MKITPKLYTKAYTRGIQSALKGLATDGSDLHENYTPPVICDMMLDKLDLTQPKSILILYNLELLFALRLRKYTGPVTFFTQSPTKAEIAPKFLPGVAVEYIDKEENPLYFMETKWPEKFDIIISNPPYSGGEKIGGGGAGSGKSIWQTFVLKCYDILPENGSMAFIHPNYWRDYFEGSSKIKGSKKEKEEIFKILTGGEATNIIMAGFFPGVKIEVDYWVIIKGRNGKCKVTYEDGQEEIVDFNNIDTPVLPFPPRSIENSILEKVRKKNYHNQVILRKGWSGSKILDPSKPIGKYKFAHGAKMLKGEWKYDKYPHIHQYENKVVICEVGKPRPLIFRTEDEIGISDKVHYWNSELERCHNIKEIMNSNVIEFLRAKIGDSWGSLPDWFISSINMEFNSNLDGQLSVYIHFSLSSDEIKFIENFLNSIND